MSLNSNESIQDRIEECKKYIEMFEKITIRYKMQLISLIKEKESKNV